jgi:polyisoprenoid-binding protein YceI
MRYIQRIPLLALALSLVAVQAFAYDGSATYEISHVYSNVSFSIMKFFFEEDGGFRSYTGEVYYDPAHPQRSHVKMTVQAASIDTRGEGRDRALRSDDFFDVEHYPTLAFVSTSVTLRSDNLLDVTGDITIHGVTKHITVPVRFLGKSTCRVGVISWDSIRSSLLIAPRSASTDRAGVEEPQCLARMSTSTWLLARSVPEASESVGVVPHLRNYPNAGSTLQIRSSALEVAYDFVSLASGLRSNRKLSGRRLPFQHCPCQV